jgi:hypothetical protein
VISFRYHIVSIVSVFLALAVGVALGGGPLKGEVDNTLVDQVRTDRQVRAGLKDQIASLRDGDAFTDEFAASAAPALLAGRLRGHVVTIVVLPTAHQAAVPSLAKLVQVAGGTVGGTLRVGQKLVDVSNKQLVGQLGTQLEGRAKNLTLPADASPYERLGALVARAIGTTRRGGAAVDGAATGILSGLSAGGLMSPQGSLDRRGDMMLFVTGPGQGPADQQRAAGEIVSTLVQAVDARTAGAVLAGPSSAARHDGQLKAVRDDVSASQHVSTVDSLNRTAGQVVAVMALAGQASGGSGQYGAVDAADGAMPGARPTTQ